MTILVADDEKDIVELIAYNLKREGFAILRAYDGHETLAKVRTDKPDLVILDLMLPGIHGFEVCRIIRKEPAVSLIPIIMLTAKSDEIDRILGLEIGADDYVTKPFSVRELTARVRAVLRRAERKAHLEKDSLRFRGLLINYNSYEVFLNGRKLDLSPTEIRLLHFFSRNPGKVFSRRQILDLVWGDDSFVEPRTVDVHIRRLRSHLEADSENPQYILTVRGAGYKFADK